MQLSNAERINLLLTHRGYIVLAALGDFKIGQILTHIGGDQGGSTGVPFEVFETATSKDADEQTKFLNTHGDVGVNDPEWTSYYKLRPKGDNNATV